jgi:hypothetical protein
VAQENFCNTIRSKANIPDGDQEFGFVPTPEVE